MGTLQQLSTRIHNVGQRFVGRLNHAVLQDALEYLDYGEATLAIDVLCDQLYEYDVGITPDEHDELVQLLRVCRSDRSGAALAELVVVGSDAQPSGSVGVDAD